MTPHPVMRSLWSLTLAASCLGAAGCASEPESTPVKDEAVTGPREPRGDQAPPLGAPRPKVLPGESFDEEDD